MPRLSLKIRSGVENKVPAQFMYVGGSTQNTALTEGDKL